jgi:hypothetical protein
LAVTLLPIPASGSDRTSSRRGKPDKVSNGWLASPPPFKGGTSVVTVPFLTTGGALVILFITGMSIQILRRKATAKKVMAATVLFTVGLEWTKTCLQEFSIFINPSWNFSVFSMIPFGNLIYRHVPTATDIFQPLFTRYFLSVFLFAIVWGFCMTYLKKSHDYKNLMIISACVLVPINVLFMVLCFAGLTMGTVFDFGSFLLLWIGSSLGWVLRTNIFRKKGDVAT